MSNQKPKILFYDIETSPSLAYMWSLWYEIKSMKFVEENWYILCWCAKWLGERKVRSSAIIDYKKKKNQLILPEDDRKVLEDLWELLDEADIVVAHNGIKFDNRKVNARFLMHGMTPPSPYKVIDTLRVARRYFAFTSNRLNDLGDFLGIGHKISTGGFKLWKRCMKGDEKAWSRMVRYCKRDVTLLEKVYKKLRPYIVNHPNLANYVNDDERICPKCGSSQIIKEGFAYTNVAKYQQYSCKSCGGWSRGRTNLRQIKVRNTNAR